MSQASLRQKKMSQTFLRQRIAERSLEWRDSDKISFIWDDQLVIAYVNRDYNQWYALTDLETDNIKDINGWLGTYLQTLDEAAEDEEVEVRIEEEKEKKRVRKSLRHKN